ncbi:hypothetical protein KAR48_21130 [bacterium]|nr:hypothetical protein [bacterium]
MKYFIKGIISLLVIGYYVFRQPFEMSEIIIFISIICVSFAGLYLLHRNEKNTNAKKEQILND